MDVKCYVPTHSLVNYSQWQIVSPEASLASLECVDGYIAQVWTGTARAQNYFNGRQTERVFETAHLEYGSMESMTAPTGRKMFFLTDPIEDQPRDWDDFKRNYQATFAAQLMYPNIANFEVMPWPERVYDGLYRVSADSEERTYIPRRFSTQMQVMVNSLNNMPLSANKVSGSEGLTVLMANSLMFQRVPVHKGYKDPQLSNFFGLALPFLKRGVPVRTAHLENLVHGALDETTVLLMSYSNYKPLDADAHRHLAQWVKDGGTLVYSSRDEDPFQTVMEWWNQNGNTYTAPSQHLFQLMQMPEKAEEGVYEYGRGKVYVVRQDPKEFVMQKQGDESILKVIEQAYGKLDYKNHFYLERGPYVLASVVDENAVSSEPLQLHGNYIDLFDPTLPCLKQKTVNPGEQTFLFNIDAVKNKKQPQVLAAASRQSHEIIGKRTYSFIADSPADTDNVMRILLPKKPKEIELSTNQFTSQWDAETHTLLLQFENNPDGVQVNIKW